MTRKQLAAEVLKLRALVDELIEGTMRMEVLHKQIVAFCKKEARHEAPVVMREWVN